MVEPLEDRRLLAVFTVDNLADAGMGSLRQAVLDANANVGADTVEFQAALSGTIALSTGELAITDEVTIDGPGAGVLIIDAQQNSRIFHITSASGPVTFEGLHLTGGNVMGNGGAIFSETSALLSIQSSTISGNSAMDFGRVYGGGIYANGDVTVTDSTISGNSVEYGSIKAGGGIAANGEVTISSSTISGNSVADRFAGSGAGGGIASRSDVTVTDSTISGNSATGRRILGGAIFTFDNVTVTDSTISDNSALSCDSYGGGIFAYDNVAVTGSTISGNSATGEGLFAAGGGIYSNGEVTVTASTISGNLATNTSGGFGVGGGISAARVVTVSGSTISGNSVTSAFGTVVGGGIFVFRGEVTVTDSTISGNSATGGRIGYGGGIDVDDGDVTVSGSTISGNSVTGEFVGRGGGIFARGNATVTRSTISGNSATSASGTAAGGGIYARDDATVTRSTISGNSATSASGTAAGGGIYARDDVTVKHGTISGNSATGATSAGGGIFSSRGPVAIENSIVAGNQTDTGTTPDLDPGTGPLTVLFSLIGDNTDTGLAEAPVGMPDANGNLIGDPGGAGIIDPLLGPLGDNGGPTFTHALLAGSPAINAGDPLFAPPPDFDQRGDPFVRVADGRIDMGAFELQPVSLDEKIQQLLDTGVLNRGQANALLVKLNPNGNERAQLNRLRAFINQVNALVRAGILSAEEGQCLIEGAESLRNVLSVDVVLASAVSSGRAGRGT